MKGEARAAFCLLVALASSFAAIADDKVDLSDLRDKKSIFDPDYEGEEGTKQDQGKPKPSSEERAAPNREEEEEAKGEWIDVLKLVDGEKHAVHGQWERKGEALHSGVSTKKGGTPRLMIPVTPRGSYQLRVRFMRQSGERAVWIILPAGQSVVTLGLGSGKGYHGLAYINGKGASDNETTVRPGTLTTNREHHLNVNVLVSAGKARIAVDLDGKNIILWEGQQSSLSGHRLLQLPDPKCLGLAAWSPTVFTEAKLCMLSGEARILSDKAAVQMAAEPGVDGATGPGTVPMSEPWKPLTEEEKAKARSVKGGAKPWRGAGGGIS